MKRQNYIPSYNPALLVWVLDKNGWIYTDFWLELYFYNKYDHVLPVTIAALIMKSNFYKKLVEFEIIYSSLEDASKQEIEAVETLKSQIER